MDGDGEILTPGQVGNRPVERLTHRVGRVGRDAESHPTRGKGTQALERGRELGEARGAFRRVRTEDFLIVDAAPAEPRQRGERRPGAAGVRHARHSGGPRVSHALLRRARELLRRRRVFQRADRANPRRELGLLVPSGQVGELEMRVRVDEARDEARFGKLPLQCSLGPGDQGVGADRGDRPVIVYENGAVLDGRRRYGMHDAGAEAEHMSSVEVSGGW
jgi:hypothetical protein